MNLHAVLLVVLSLLTLYGLIAVSVGTTPARRRVGVLCSVLSFYAALLYLLLGL